MVVELTSDAKEYLLNKKETDAVTVKMVMCGG